MARVSTVEVQEEKGAHIEKVTLRDDKGRPYDASFYVAPVEGELVYDWYFYGQRRGTITEVPGEVGDEFIVHYEDFGPCGSDKVTYDSLAAAQFAVLDVCQGYMMILSEGADMKVDAYGEEL